jgi:hypothetical protein
LTATEIVVGVVAVTGLAESQFPPADVATDTVKLWVLVLVTDRV